MKYKATLTLASILIVAALILTAVSIASMIYSCRMARKVRDESSRIFAMLEENSIIPEELLELEETIVVVMSNELSEQQIRVIVRDEYATYQSNIGMILTITGVALAFFAVAIPIMSYVFVQKDHLEKLEDLQKTTENIVTEIREAAIALDPDFDENI